MTYNCVFCDLVEHPEHLSTERVMETYSMWVAFQPIAPVNDGHRLLVPRRHVASFHELSQIEAAELPYVLRTQRLRLGADYYNLGVNCGVVAGQTVFHLHVHLIPREDGDVEDYRGGIISPLGALLDGTPLGDFMDGVERTKSAEGAAL